MAHLENADLAYEVLKRSFQHENPFPEAEFHYFDPLRNLKFSFPHGRVNWFAVVHFTEAEGGVCVYITCVMVDAPRLQQTYFGECHYVRPFGKAGDQLLFIEGPLKRIIFDCLQDFQKPTSERDLFRRFGDPEAWLERCRKIDEIRNFLEAHDNTVGAVYIKPPYSDPPTQKERAKEEAPE